MKEFYITLLKIVWHFIPKFTKIATLIILAEMAAVIMVANPQDRFGLVIGFMFMLPFILLVLFMSIIERYEIELSAWWRSGENATKSSGSWLCYPTTRMRDTFGTTGVYKLGSNPFRAGNRYN